MWITCYFVRDFLLLSAFLLGNYNVKFWGSKDEKLEGINP